MNIETTADIDFLEKQGMLTLENLNNYRLSEDAISNLIERDIIGEYLFNNKLNESIVRKLIGDNLIELERLADLSTSTYSTLSYSFIQEYIDNVDIIKYISYIVASASNDEDILKHIDLIEKYDLFDTISAFNYKTETIRKYKNKLNWKKLILVKSFNLIEEIEFKDYIENISYEENKILVESSININNNDPDLYRQPIDDILTIIDSISTNLKENGYIIDVLNTSSLFSDVRSIVVKVFGESIDSELELFNEFLSNINNNMKDINIKYSAGKGNLVISINNIL